VSLLLVLIPSHPNASVRRLAGVNGILLRSIPDRLGERVFAFSGRVRPVHYFRRDPRRQFRPRLVLYAGGIHRLFVGQSSARRLAGVLGRGSCSARLPSERLES